MTTPGAATSLLGQVGMQQHSQQSENGAGQEPMIAVPAAFFGRLLGGLAGGAIGRAVGGKTGGAIGKGVGGALGGLLPFQVIPAGTDWPMTAATTATRPQTAQLLVLLYQYVVGNTATHPALLPAVAALREAALHV